MPTYEYACTDCKRHFEIFQSFSEAPLEICEVCGGKLRRVFHPVGIVLKGSGFYSTDNRGGKKFTPATETKDTKGDSPSDAGSTSKGSETSSSTDKKADTGGKDA
jgi:putative FmdB family regulatory protein